MGGTPDASGSAWRATDGDVLARLERFERLTDVAADIAFTYRIDSESGEVALPEWITEHAFEEITGYTVDEWRALGGWPALIHPEDHDLVRERIGHLTGATDALTAEYRIVTKGGDLRWLRVNSRMVVDGDETFVYGAALDVTDEKRTEQALAESEARLREAQAIAHVGSWHWDVQADTVTWSDELYRIYRLAPDEFTPTYEGYMEHVHPEDRAMGANHLRRTLEHDKPYDHEYRIVRPDGEVRWLFTQAHVVRDVNGAPLAMHGSCWDVTERHEAEVALAQTAADLNEAQALAGLGSWAFDLDGEVLRWSDEMFVLHGLDPDSEPLTMQDYVDLVEPEDRALIGEIGEAVTHGLDAYDFEYRIRIDDETRWLQARGHPVRVDGRLVGLRGTVLDVTTQKAAQQALRDAVERERSAVERLRDADRLKDEFISTASHELRTPLTAIVGFASALSRGVEDEAMRRTIVEKIERNALSLGTLVERLLDFSQLQAGTVHLEPGAVPVLDATVRAEEYLIGELDDHAVEHDVPDGLCVTADPTALHHVLTNLLGNAAKYAPAGTTITVAAREAQGGVEIRLADQGPGMDAEVAARVFERFYRGPDQPGGQRGSGIGLAIVKSYVDLMGGTIEVESEPGAGTTFVLCLPAAERTAQLAS